MPDLTIPTRFLIPDPDPWSPQLARVVAHASVALVEPDQEAEDAVSLRPEKTGVENTIFVSTRGYAEYSPHIKIAVDPPHTFNAASKSASMAIHGHGIRGESVAPHIAEQAKRFIDLNREALFDYWDCKIDTSQLIERLTPIDPEPTRPPNCPRVA